LEAYVSINVCRPIFNKTWLSEIWALRIFMR
jgi:hypothetical protein